MSETGEGDARTLAELRARIDAIDAEMHRLLIERGTAIDSLIGTKGTSRPGAAFRPGREAEMMRRIVGRHSGALPLATVEHIWREIIATFTRMQAPFDVAVDVSVEPRRMRDLARFVFGFSVAIKEMDNAAAVIERVGAANDLGLIARSAEGAWWRGLAAPSGPRIMAMLPFIRAHDRPADMPAFVISPPLSDPTPPDVAAFAVGFDGPPPDVAGCAVVASAGSEVLLATPGNIDEAELARLIRGAGATARSIAPVGGFARGVATDGGPDILYERVRP
jgi:chorismate mutase